MVRIILTADETLTSTYRDIPLLDFIGCSPIERVPKFIYNLLDSQLPHENGILSIAPYSLRKIEASLLLNGYKENEIVVAHPRYVEYFINKETEIVGISTMDPLGLGPVTMMFTMGGKLTSYTKNKFIGLLEKINRIRKREHLKFKIVVGGSGAWQLEYRFKDAKKLGIDHIVIGETEHVIADLFNDISTGIAKEIIKIRGFPKVSEIPTIIRPSYKGMVEVMRGCGRNCEFCEPNLRRARNFPIEKILEEVKINTKYGIHRTWLHSEDIFLYMLEDHKYFYPNSDAVIELFDSVMKQPGINYVNPTHGTIAPAVADPDMIRKISEIVGSGPGKWIGIQPGLETGSSRLIWKYMPNKAKPFSPDEWVRVVLEGTYIFNKYYWFPAYTLIIGLPGEDEEDALDTARLIITMEKVLEERLGKGRAHFTVTPLSFIPLGVLRGEEFFNIEEQMTEGRFLVLYHSWRHLALEVRRALPYILKDAYNKMVFMPIAKVGSQLILRYLRAWGKKMGYDPEKPLKPLEIKLSVMAS